MTFNFRSRLTLFLVAAMIAALGACSSSSSPTADDGISSLKGIGGAFDESGESGIHPDTWEGDHQGLPQADLAACVSCHADTAVDEEGCLPCHDPAADVEEEGEEGEKESPHPEGWEDDHQKTPADAIGSCIACHADTSVDEEGCLPCHTGSDDSDDEGDDEADDGSDGSDDDDGDDD